MKQAAYSRIKSKQPGHAHFKNYVDLASQDMGSRILACSDDFFCRGS